MSKKEIEAEPEENGCGNSFLSLYLLLGIGSFMLALYEGQNFTHSLLVSLSYICGIQLMGVCVYVPIVIYKSIIKSLGFNSIVKDSNIFDGTNPGKWIGISIISLILAFYFAKWVFTKYLLFLFIFMVVMLILGDFMEFLKRKSNSAG